MRRRHDRTDAPASDVPAPLPRAGSRAATPWVTVAAGAGAVTLVVAVAGMVGAATGVGESVVVGVSADGGALVEDGVPAVTPRPEAPRPEVTRIPPPDRAGATDDPAGTDPEPEPPTGTGGEPPASASGPDPAPTTTEPATAPTTPAPAVTPAEPAPTSDPDPASVTWVQERLRVHGADVEVTGTLDDATVAALRAFQQAHGLAGDGAVTAATAEALAAAPGTGSEESTDPGGTSPAEPTPTPSTDRPSTVAPGQSSTTSGETAGTDLGPAS
ncbi:peptidoglycan-binding domain-containing protein [Cellulosimicrobium protaetiae]|uniref:Peptidoglycan-binding protein n=1 Tax=Cellulosimicrobium protaetiae TaxID=2587808 RepID=A0A6M5UM88_9MICO|nr:peptidoglycan-binding domain-containing protein [Cellulosimicrobium protaetiae]QJW37969.1 peptidoglycan-binding protein [Cellulosimicrobium protaetiae]